MVALLEQYGLGAVVPDFSVASLRTVIAGLTPETIAGWKSAADAAAHALSAQAQQQEWVDAIERLFARA